VNLLKVEVARLDSHITLISRKGTNDKYIMTNSLQVAKKAFSVAVAATTILWSVGLSAFLPTAASAAAFGDLIKGTTLKTVYYYGSDGQRYAFPNEKTYFSWYNDFSTVKTISDSELAAITLAGNVAYRPGSRWVKITSDAKVYAVSTSGKVRWIENEATAKGLGGDAWNTHIDDVPDVFFTDYSVGDSLTSPVSGYDGMVWSDGTSKYLVSGTTYSKLTDAGFAANHYKAGAVLSGTGFTKSGLTSGAEISAAMANLTDAAQKVKTATYAVSQNVSVALSSTAPAASTVVAGQALANLAAFDFTNSTSAPVSVKSLSLHRTGVSSDATLSNIYLFSGYVRLTDSASVSSGVASFNDAAGLFTIPAGGKVTVNVRSDIKTGSSGQTLGVSLNSASDVSFVGAFAAAGTFPLSGALMTVAATPDSFGTVSFGKTTTPGAIALDPATDVRLWENTITVGNNASWLYSLRFRNIGSINTSDIGNWRVYVAGVLRGSAVPTQDANGYITFDLSGAPIKLETGTDVIKVVADITGGSTRTVTLGLRTAADAVFLDDQYKQPILVQAVNSIDAVAAYSSRDAGAQTISSGSLSVTKRTDSPSLNVTKGASGAVLARFDVKASGEPIKVESMNFQVLATADTVTTYALRNGAIFLNGTQIGNTTQLCGSNTTGTGCTSISGSGDSYTNYAFGSSFVVYPGTPAVLEVRADIYNSLNTSEDLTDRTVQASIHYVLGANNVFKKTSAAYVSFPASASDVKGNVLTVKSGVLTVLKNTAFAGQKTVAPKTAYKIGSYTITSSVSEPINLNSLTVDLDDSSGSPVAADFGNMFVKFGPAGNMTTLATKVTPSVSAGANVFSTDYVLQPNTTIYVDAYSDINSNPGVTTIITALNVGATNKNSGGTPSGANADVPGQSIELTTGKFAGTLDSQAPTAALYAGNQTVTAAKYRFTATNETYSLDTVVFNIPASAVGVATSVALYDGASVTPVATQVFNGDSGASATFNSLGFSVPAGTAKILTAKLTLGAVASVGGAPSQVNTALTLTSFTSKDSQGVAGPITLTNGVGREVNVTKSVPTIAAVDLTNNTIVNGQAITLYKFTVTASGGDLALKQFTFPITWGDGVIGGGADTMTVGSLKFYKNLGTDITPTVNMMSLNTGTSASATDALTGNTALSNNPGATADTGLLVSFVSEDVIAMGETATYYVVGTPGAFAVNNGTTLNADTFTMYLAGDSCDNTTAGTCANGANITNKTYLNESTQASGVWRLHTAAVSIVGDSTASFIWSDLSGASTNGGHSSDDDALSSNDWANGYLVLSLDLPGETWSK